MERREFLASVAVTALGAAASADDSRRGEMLYRKLGSTGVEVSAIGLGGHHIGRQKEEADSIKIIRSAIDAGITFMDNCWDYHNGLSEIRMGKALKDGYRDRVVLMTKIDGRTKKVAALQIDESLTRLQTDHIDVLQHHEILRFDDPDRVFDEGGSMEAVLEAKKAGKIRFIGFTGHKDPQIHLRMLEIADEKKFTFDTVQMPLNVMDAHFRSFGQKVLPELVKRKIGVLGMKSNGDGYILKSKTVTAVETLQFALSLPTSVVIRGIDSLEILKQDLKTVKEFKPLTADQMAALLKKTSEAAMTGKFELFKTSAKFDGTAKHDEWLSEPEPEPGKG